MDIDRIKLYYISFNMYIFSRGLVSVFINLFVLVASSLLGVIYFNLMYFTGLEISYFGCAYFLDRTDPKQLYITGVVTRALTLILILATASVVSNILFFGLLYGISIGTFWLGNNILTSDISKGTDRVGFVYRNSAIEGMVSFAAPILAGISTLPGPIVNSTASTFPVATSNYTT